MALVKDPLNSLKIRERGQETGRSWAACNPGQANGLQGLPRVREGPDPKRRPTVPSPRTERDVVRHVSVSVSIRLVSASPGDQRGDGTPAVVWNQQRRLDPAVCRHGWLHWGRPNSEFPKRGPCAGLEWDSLACSLVLLSHLQGKGGHPK